MEKEAIAVILLPVSESTTGLQALSCILLAGGRGAEHRQDRTKKIFGLHFELGGCNRYSLQY